MAHLVDAILEIEAIGYRAAFNAGHDADTAKLEAMPCLRSIEVQALLRIARPRERMSNRAINGRRRSVGIWMPSV
ncbi:hypothetical protein DMP17_05690 [Pseudonocardia sp. TMWB2A]